MVKKHIIGIFIFLFIFATGCGLLKDSKTEPSDFKKGDSGLVMEFVQNYPGDRYLISDDVGLKEEISIIIDVRNKGTFPDGEHFDEGKIYISGFDDKIIDMSGIADKTGLSQEEIKLKQREGKTENLSAKFLPAASAVNPLGGFDTAEFDGKIIGDKITVDRYTPSILVTACYPYVTKASPTVCVDPFPFDDRQEKVCRIGTQTLSSQGAPVQVTKVEQEASTNKIQFKIHIENVGDGDIIKSNDSNNLEDNGSKVSTLDRCSPLGNGLLDRKDFDRVQLKKVQIGNVDLLGTEKCSPFADGTADKDIKLLRLFDGEGFVICTLTVSDLDTVQSAYTTPLNIELGYNYRSTISKQVQISKLKTVG